MDQVIGYILRQLYFNQKAGPNQALTFAFRECNSEIVIFGASQAQHNYDPRIISNSLKMNCYNAGQDGGHSILLQYAQIKELTERYSPKIIILEFHPNNIVRYQGDYDRLQILLPYYSDYPELHQLIQLRSPYEKIKLLSAIYPFNSNIINIIRFNTITHASRRQDFNGYIPLKGRMNNEKVNINNQVGTSEIADTNMVIALKNIIRLCHNKHISLFIISSPIYHRTNELGNSSSVAKLTLDILKRNQVHYLDFTFDSSFTGHLALFKDKMHLNEQGAKVFTSKLVLKLKNMN